AIGHYGRHFDNPPVDNRSKELTHFPRHHIITPDAFEQKIRDKRTLVGHGDPHDMVKLPYLRSTESTTPSRGGKHIVFGVVPGITRVTVQVTSKHRVGSSLKKGFYIRPSFRITFLRPQWLVHEDKCPPYISVFFQRLLYPFKLLVSDSA